MSQASKMILVAFIATVIGGGGVYLWQVNESPGSPPVSTQEQRISDPEATTKSTVETEFAEVAKYNCEKSSGTFRNNSCECPLEGGQTQEMMYDKNTGYCQTTYGGPGGDAFAASIGLPYGTYAFWGEIVGNACNQSGGVWSTGAFCKCSDGFVYDTSTGACKTQ